MTISTKTNTSEFARFTRDESGATAIEYGLIAAIVALGIITTLSLLRDQLVVLFTFLSNAFQTALQGG